MSPDGPPVVGQRRPPPPFRRVKVARTQRLSPRLCRVTLFGPELDGFRVEQPAASVRVLLPPADGSGLVIPDWTGNQFQLPDGSRPVLRTLTPRRVREGMRELDVDVVIHDGGAASEWAQGARPGDDAAVSGPARGYSIDPDSPRFFLAGDETAIPAISQLAESLPAAKPILAVIEIASPAAKIELPPRIDAVNWLELPAGAPPGASLVAAVRDAELAPETRLWIAGEAASVQRIRRHLFEERGFPRPHAAVRGYWKHGRTGGDSE